MAAVLVLSGLGLAGGRSFAAEFEILDRFSVDGYTVLRGSADIPGGSLAVGGSTFAVKGGKVGIGTTSPGGKLSVVPAASDNYSLFISSQNGTTGNLVVANSGNVGVGTTNPLANFDVAGGIKLSSFTSCASETAGTLRWYDGHISVCNGSAWRQLDNQPPPTITLIDPPSGLLTLQTAITIDGTGFTAGPEILIDGVTATNISVVSTTRITATTPAGTVGQKVVKITNPDGQYITGAFTYNALPVITTLSPNFGLKAAAITITGTGFAAGATVKIGDIDAAGVRVSATQITATAPSNSFINSKDVKVTNPDTGAVTLTNGFTYFTGTGGTITTPAGYRVHTFTSGDTFTPNYPGSVEVLVVAGGGGTGYDVGGGGGGGGVVYHSAKAVTPKAYTVTVGGGGASGQSSDVRGSNGANSVFDDITALGGGGGGTYPTTGTGLAGGSGGGAGNYGAGGGAATQGNSGGGTGYGNAGGSSAAAWGSGGGGGALSAGANGITGTAVNGGAGYTSAISGSSVEYGKGGKGNSDGGTIDATPAYTGQGANGTGAPNNSPYSGGSGIVIIRYPN